MSKQNEFLIKKNGVESMQALKDTSLKLSELLKNTIADSQSIKIIPKPNDRIFYEFVDTGSMGYSLFKPVDAKLPNPHRKLPGIRTPFAELCEEVQPRCS